MNILLSSRPLLLVLMTNPGMGVTSILRGVVSVSTTTAAATICGDSVGDGGGVAAFGGGTTDDVISGELVDNSGDGVGGVASLPVSCEGSATTSAA